MKMNEADMGIIRRLTVALTGNENPNDEAGIETAQQIMLATLVLRNVTEAVIQSIPNSGPSMSHAQGLAISIVSLLYTIKSSSQPNLNISQTAQRLIDMALIVGEDTEMQLAPRAKFGNENNKEVS